MQTLTQSNELCHWGIKGQRWGVRRYQNKDGTLTPEGQKRYNDSDGDDRKTSSVADRKSKVLSSHSAKELYKNKDLFDDKELRDAYVRLSTEQNIKNMIPEEISVGRKLINKYNDTSKTIKNIVDSSMDLYKSYEKAADLVNRLRGSGSGGSGGGTS